MLKRKRILWLRFFNVVSTGFLCGCSIVKVPIWLYRTRHLGTTAPSVDGNCLLLLLLFFISMFLSDTLLLCALSCVMVSQPQAQRNTKSCTLPYQYR